MRPFLPIVIHSGRVVARPMRFCYLGCEALIELVFRNKLCAEREFGLAKSTYYIRRYSGAAPGGLVINTREVRREEARFKHLCVKFPKRFI